MCMEPIGLQGGWKIRVRRGLTFGAQLILLVERAVIVETGLEDDMCNKVKKYSMNLSYSIIPGEWKETRRKLVNRR